MKLGEYIKALEQLHSKWGEVEVVQRDAYEDVNGIGPHENNVVDVELPDNDSVRVCRRTELGSHIVVGPSDDHDFIAIVL